MSSEVPPASDARPGLTRRLAAAAAIALAVAAVVVGLVSAMGDLVRLVVVPLALLVAVLAAWTAATRVGVTRTVASGVGLLAVALAVATTLTGEAHGLALALVIALVAVSTALTRHALAHDGAASTGPGAPAIAVPPARRSVLIMNLRSGGGKAERFGLEDECRRRGIEPVVLRPGDDLRRLAQDAIDAGADVIGMAGGDGSQAMVASIAMRADVAMVCVPAGTRNHFALDLGLDREDVVGALDAFGEALERRIDLASVGDTVFVNNVSLGVYANIVQSEEYRDSKRQTTTAMLPELLGPDADPFDLHFVGPDGRTRDGARIIQVSNNPYVLTSYAGFGSRARLDTGELGIAAVTIAGAADAAAFVAAGSAGRLHRFPGWAEWTAPAFRVDSGRPVEAGVDGEAVLLDPPLLFRLHPGAVRIRIPHSAPGRSPAATGSTSPWRSLRDLGRTALGRTPYTDATAPNPTVPCP